MRRLVALVLLVAVCVPVSARIKIGIAQIGDSGRPSELLNSVRELISVEPELDLIVGPDCALGGRENKARIRLTYFPDSVVYEAADTYEVSREVVAALDTLCELARAHSITILPGTIWEVDSFCRVFRTVPIISPRGIIVATRRKLRQLYRAPFIDPTIKLDTVFTHDGSSYTYLITISNEAMDLPKLYSASASADIWILMQWNYVDDVNQLVEQLEFSDSVAWSVVYNVFPDSIYDWLLTSGWISDSSLVVISSRAEHSGAFWLNALSLDTTQQVIPGYAQVSSGAIVNVDPYSRDPLGRIVVVAKDSFGAPQESVFTFVVNPDSSYMEFDWTDSNGVAEFDVKLYGQYTVVTVRWGSIVRPTESMVMVSYINPVCTLNVLAYDTTGIFEDLSGSEPGVVIFPNPSGCISFSVPAGVDEAEVVDISGRVVGKAVATTKGLITWRPRNSLPAGVYFIRSSSGKIYGKIIVIK